MNVQILTILILQLQNDAITSLSNQLRQALKNRKETTLNRNCNTFVLRLRSFRHV